MVVLPTTMGQSVVIEKRRREGPRHVGTNRDGQGGGAVNGEDTRTVVAVCCYCRRLHINKQSGSLLSTSISVIKKY